MRQDGIDLPSGYRLTRLDAVDSTNSEALRRAQAGHAGGLWVWAASQENGRGRSGRAWSSPPGNLHASLLIRPGVPLTTALQLSLLAGVAAHDAIATLASGANARPDLRLKWPNDILLGGAKLGGILLESAADPQGGEPAVVIGVGVNLAHAPLDLSRPVTSLAAHRIGASPAQAMAALAWTMAEWLARWRGGDGFDAIRAAWLERAQPVGGAISVNLGAERVSGAFLGIDDAGALRLALESGEERRITAGDVAIGAGV